MKLYNNGYLVKRLLDNPYEPYIPSNKEYRGLARYFSWPLLAREDAISKKLNTLFHRNIFIMKMSIFGILDKRH